MDRRYFLRATSAGLVAALAVSDRGVADETSSDDARTITWPAEEIPVVDECDVVVCGAGPAGVSAAIAAARAGAKTRLIEANGCLGGVWTAGLLTVVLDFGNKQGLMREYMDDMRAQGGSLSYGHAWTYHPERMKRLLEAKTVEAGASIRLHTRCAGAIVEDGRLRGVVTDSKSGREAFLGRVFIDATGDGDLAAQAGCGFDYGRDDDGHAQPMSLIALVDGVQGEEIATFVRGLAEPLGERSPKTRLREELERAGFTPSYSSPSFFLMPGDLFCMVVTHMYRVRGFDAGDLTQATLDARAETFAAVDALRSLGGKWANLEIVTTAEHIGVREGRRIRGLYTVTEKDLAIGRTHDDAVCRVTFGVDVHSPNPDRTKGFDHGKTPARPYDIPYRALLAKDVDNLLLAGRCISGDFIAHSSYRVTGDSVAIGEATGLAAAFAVENGCSPRDVPWKELRDGAPSES